MKVIKTYWVIVDEIAIDYSVDVRVIGVYTNKNDAIKKFKQHVETNIIPLANQNGFVIYFDELSTYFDAGSKDHYDSDHAWVHIQEINMEEE